MAAADRPDEISNSVHAGTSVIGSDLLSLLLFLSREGVSPVSENLILRLHRPANNTAGIAK